MAVTPKEDTTFDPSLWTKVEIDLGKKIEFDEVKNRIYIGTYRGETEVDTTNDKGEPEKAAALLFSDANGEDRFAWASYALKIAAGQLTVGDLVRIEFEGYDQLDGGRTVGKYKVHHRSN
jgi:hypothetical protein